MNKIIEKEKLELEAEPFECKIKTEDMIYGINGKQVMLDSDLVRLYGTETKRINEAVRNGLDKLPERYSWKLTKKEIETRGERYKNHRVFTEQGLATILKTKIAIEVSIVIMDAFVMMRKNISTDNYEKWIL